MSLHASGRDVYLRYTSASGAVSVATHRVCDVHAFLAAREAAARRQNEQAEEGSPRLASVRYITREEYLAEGGR